MNATCTSRRAADGALDGDHAHGWYGPPLPLKAALVAGAFAFCPPLALAALAWFLIRGCGGGHWHGPRLGDGPHGRHGRRRGFGYPRSAGNSAFDEKRAETLKKLDEEAEAFAAFRREERAKRDREIFDRFQKERGGEP